MGAAQAMQNEEVDALRKAVVVLMQRQAFEDALTAVNDALCRAPGDPSLRCHKGEILRALRRFTESVDWLETILAECPGSADILYQLSASTLATGLFVRTIGLARALLDQQPGHLGAWLVLIDALARNGEPKEALSAVDTALRYPLDHPHLTLRRGIVLRQLHRFEEAAGWLAELRIRAQTSPELLPAILTELAGAEASSGRLAAAIATMKEAIERSPDHAGLLVSLIQMEIQAFDAPAAMAHLEQGLARWPDHPALRRLLVNLLMQTGRMRDADETLRQFGREHDDQMRWVDLAFRRFAKVRREIGELEKDGSAAGLQRFYLLQAEGQQTQSAQLAGELHAAEPQNPVHVVNVLNDAIRNHDSGAARQLLENCPPTVRQSSAVQMAEAAVLQLEGRVEEAAAVLSDGFHRHPPGLAQIIALADLALQEGIGTQSASFFLTRAKELIAAAADQLPERTCRILQLRLAFTQGDWPEALELLDVACAEAPGDMNLLQMKARCLYELEDFGTSERLLASVLEQAPADRGAIDLRKAVLLARGDLCGCLDFLEAKADAGHTALDTWLLSALCDTGQVERARSLAQRLLPNQPVSFDWKIETFRKLFLGTSEPVPDKTWKTVWSRPISERDLQGLLHGADWDGPSGSALHHTQYFAQRNLCPVGMDGLLWRRKAFRAGHVDQVMSTRVLLEAIPSAFGRSAGFASLRERVEGRQPTMIVSTHFGARFSVALKTLMRDLVYVVGPLSQMQRSGDDAVRVLSTFDSTRLAASVVRSLRNGDSVYLARDLSWTGFRPLGPESSATGTLLGKKVMIDDIVPKISQAMHVPVYWFQSQWSGDDVEIDVMRMPDAEEGEPRDVWCRRWAQAYLDKVEALFRSDPRNARLSHDLLNYLMITSLHADGGGRS
ncbi:tetratricopeptide repeat protein [Rhizobium sp. CSW-27]|uniref:tetratricopeptide repeat protein n=1 Tax=Rhizobium sp. CSW-27 TaxID=2839985 RepID=UPI00207919EC|nr:tetratricopeptide repeat protein [Rhizobium sp. CSW-27]